MSTMSKLLCLLCLFYLIPVFMLLLFVLAPCTLSTWLVQGLVARYLAAGTGGRSAPVLLVPTSHPDAHLASALRKSREVQTCSVRPASSQAASVQGYSESTLSGFHHHFYKAHPLTKCGWTCRETAQRSCSLTELLVLALKLWEGTRFFSRKLVPESAP